jgi:hypothetical protein
MDHARARRFDVLWKATWIQIAVHARMSEVYAPAQAIDRSEPRTPWKLLEGDIRHDEARRTRPGCPQCASDQRESGIDNPDGFARWNPPTRWAWVQLFVKPIQQRWWSKWNWRHNRVGRNSIHARWKQCCRIDLDRGSCVFRREQRWQLDRGNRRCDLCRRSIGRYRWFSRWCAVGGKSRHRWHHD